MMYSPRLAHAYVNVLDESNDPPLSARYALTAVPRVIPPSLKDAESLGVSQAKCHCYGIMPINTRYVSSRQS
jgi:hypothetical protein